MHSHHVLFLALLTPLAASISHPLTPAFPSSSFSLLDRRQICPATQVCGEICCQPPAICDTGAFNWCQVPGGGEDEPTCEAGKALCSDGASCCRIGFTCDLEARLCLDPSATDVTISVSSTSSVEAEETESSSTEESISITSTTSITRSTSSETASASTSGPSQTSAPAAASPTPTGGSTKTSNLQWEVLGMGVLLVCLVGR